LRPPADENGRMLTTIGLLACLSPTLGTAGESTPLSLTEVLAAERTEAFVDDGQALPPPERLPVYASLSRRFELKLGGGLYGNFDTALTVSSDVLVGAKLDLEDTLGIDDSKSVFRLDANYAFSPRHELRLGAFDLNRSGSRTIGEELEIGEVVIPAGSSLDSEFGTTIFKLAYLYNFVADHRTMIGLSAGLHTMRIDTAFATTTGSIEESFKATAPLPVFGLHSEYALSRKWRMLGSIEFFQLDIGEFEGGLTDLMLGLEHDLFEHVGWGFAYNGFNMDATFEDDPLKADLVYQYQGLLLYLRCYW
jgi:hypothetical protein